jgi:hypothetical protein
MQAKGVTVIQADRDAAAAFLREDRHLNSISAGLIETGDWDRAPIVHAFARHRIAHATPTPEAAPGAEIERAIRFCDERANSYGALRPVAPTAIALDRASALLRALSTPPVGPTREEIAEAAYTAHVKRNKPWAVESLFQKERWRASADAVIAILQRTAGQ